MWLLDQCRQSLQTYLVPAGYHHGVGTLHTGDAAADFESRCQGPWKVLE